MSEEQHIQGMSREQIKAKLLREKNGVPGSYSRVMDEPRLRDDPALFWGLVFIVGVLVVIGIVVISFTVLIVALMWWGIIAIGGAIFP